MVACLFGLSTFEDACPKSLRAVVRRSAIAIFNGKTFWSIDVQRGKMANLEILSCMSILSTGKHLGGTRVTLSTVLRTYLWEGGRTTGAYAYVICSSRKMHKLNGSNVCTSRWGIRLRDLRTLQEATVAFCLPILSLMLAILNRQSKFVSHYHTD